MLLSITVLSVNTSIDGIKTLRHSRASSYVLDNFVHFGSRYFVFENSYFCVFVKYISFCKYIYNVWQTKEDRKNQCFGSSFVFWIEWFLKISSMFQQLLILFRACWINACAWEFQVWKLIYPIHRQYPEIRPRQIIVLQFLHRLPPRSARKQTERAECLQSSAATCQIPRVCEIWIWKKTSTRQFRMRRIGRTTKYTIILLSIFRMKQKYLRNRFVREGFFFVRKLSFIRYLQEIDGHSLLLMTRLDVLTSLKLKLGPALKIYRHVLKLQIRRDDQKLYWL